MTAKTAKPKNAERKCPITGQTLAYTGRGRPKVFADSVTAADRRAYRAKNAGK